MKKMNNDVKAFIQRIKNPDELIEGCRKFHEMEPRDIAYVVSNALVSKNPSDRYYILAGAKIFLLTWNAVYYQRLEEEVKQKLESEILDAYEQSRNMLNELKNEKLETLDLNNTHIADIIKECFRIFSSKKSIGITGASKVLHLINPKVFMMWDNRIKAAYHKIHPSYKKRKEPVEECYLEFMKTSQEIIRSLLEKLSYEEIWEKHLSFLDKNFVNAFPLKEPLTKMLDECNYMKFTKYKLQSKYTLKALK